MRTWLGVDVGGKRKGFDVAVIDASDPIDLRPRQTVEDVVALVAEHQPLIIAIDSPCRCAPDGERSRASERAVARSVCHIRYTPDRKTVESDEFYAWIVEGLDLYETLKSTTTTTAIEVFPTASWTRWSGPRAGTQRSDWTRESLVALELGQVPRRTNQDERDAIAAAMTARQHSAGTTETFGDEIVVPNPGTSRRRIYADIVMPASFRLQFLTHDGLWAEHGQYAADQFVRDFDGSYCCATGESSPLYLRCRHQEGNVIYSVDQGGAGPPRALLLAPIE